jgi:hypothetical protein
LAAAGAAAVVVAAMAGTQGLAAEDAQAGAVWVVTRGPAGSALARLMRRSDVRIANEWGGGRLVQLHVDSLRAFDLPSAGRWLVWRQSAPAPGWPACG